jgi:hypothetical protein
MFFLFFGRVSESKSECESEWVSETIVEQWRYFIFDSNNLKSKNSVAFAPARDIPKLKLPGLKQRCFYELWWPLLKAPTKRKQIQKVKYYMASSPIFILIANSFDSLRYISTLWGVEWTSWPISILWIQYTCFYLS